MRKWLHRQVCESYLPKSILRRKKRGFAVNVVDEWFRGALNQQLQQALSDPSSAFYACTLFLKTSQSYWRSMCLARKTITRFS